MFCFERLYVYLFNDKYRFRSHEVFDTIDHATRAWAIQSPHFKAFLQGLLSKQVALYEASRKLKKDD